MIYFQIQLPIINFQIQLFPSPIIYVDNRGRKRDGVVVSTAKKEVSEGGRDRGYDLVKSWPKHEVSKSGWERWEGMIKSTP
jgi:hypothetical protein